MGDRSIRKREHPVPEHKPARKELHEALRAFAIQPEGFTWWGCAICEKCWNHYQGQPERHASDCLAAPDALTRGDEG